jgi:hypothetical protein
MVMTDTYTASATTQINLSYDQTVDLLINFLEREYDTYVQGLASHCRDYSEEQKEYMFEDIKDNVKILEAIQHVISYYKVP